MTPTEQVALENARVECLSLAVDLEEVSASLRLVALGLAGPADRTIVRGALDRHGDLVVRGQLPWALLLAHSGDDVVALEEDAP
jgi:hypothetical protein